MFKGTITIMTTPFTESGDIDIDQIQKDTEYFIDIGVNMVVATGSIGEVCNLSDEERVLIWKTVKKTARNRIPVFAATIHTGTTPAIKISKKAHEIGMDGIMNMAPYYWALSDDEILNHYEKLDRAINIPIMIYNNVNVTRRDLSPGLIRRIGELENVKAIKETTPSLWKLEQVVRIAGDTLDVCNGLSVMHEPYATIMGCPAMVDPFTSFLGPITVKIHDLSVKGMYKEAYELKKKSVVPIIDYLFSFASVGQIISAYKYISFKEGLRKNTVIRPPLKEIDDEKKRKIDELLELTRPYRK